MLRFSSFVLVDESISPWPPKRAPDPKTPKPRRFIGSARLFGPIDGRWSLLVSSHEHGPSSVLLDSCCDLTLLNSMLHYPPSFVLAGLAMNCLCLTQPRFSRETSVLIKTFTTFAFTYLRLHDAHRIPYREFRPRSLVGRPVGYRWLLAYDAQSHSIWTIDDDLDLELQSAYEFEVLPEVLARLPSSLSFYFEALPAGPIHLAACYSDSVEQRRSFRENALAPKTTRPPRTVIVTRNAKPSSEGKNGSHQNPSKARKRPN